MGKTSKWLRIFLTGKKDREREKCTINQNSPTPCPWYPTTPVSVHHHPKEKRRWSFRRSSATAATPKDLYHPPLNAMAQPVIQTALDRENEENRHALAVAAATAAAADAAVAVAQAAAAAIWLTETVHVKTSAHEEAAAIKIQSVFRSYLARKALRALRGLVKLQALVRGYLVRKQAKVTLRCMQALVTAQVRARAHRIRMIEGTKSSYSWQPILIKSINGDYFDHTDHDFDGGMDKNIKIVEMDRGEYKRGSKNGTSYTDHPAQAEQHEIRLLTNQVSATHYPYKGETYHVSPAPSALTDISGRGYSHHFEDYAICTRQSSPQDHSAVSKPDPSRIPFAFPKPECIQSLSFEYPLFPNYMANTESSRAKVRSQSAPKARPESLERQSSKRRPSMEGKNVPRTVLMQRSSSHAGSAAQNYQYPSSMKLDKSTVSLIDSECGSSSTVLTNISYYRSLVECEGQRNRY